MDEPAELAIREHCTMMRNRSTPFHAFSRSSPLATVGTALGVYLQPEWEGSAAIARVRSALPNPLAPRDQRMPQNETGAGGAGNRRRSFYTPANEGGRFGRAQCR